MSFSFFVGWFEVYARFSEPCQLTTYSSIGITRPLVRLLLSSGGDLSVMFLQPKPLPMQHGHSMGCDLSPLIALFPGHIRWGEYLPAENCIEWLHRRSCCRRLGYHHSRVPKMHHTNKLSQLILLILQMTDDRNIATNNVDGRAAAAAATVDADDDDDDDDDSVSLKAMFE